MAWLPDTVTPPRRAELPTGHHLRHIRAADAEIDYRAVMGSEDRLRARFGPVYGWPPIGMTLEFDRQDLARHEREAAARQSFNYAIFDPEETELLGCVYLDPPSADAPGSDVTCSWWVVDKAVGSDLEQAMEAFVGTWLRETWGFRQVHMYP